MNTNNNQNPNHNPPSSPPPTPPPPPKSLPPKKSSALIWILLILFFLFILFVGGGYAAWVFVVKPKMASGNLQKQFEDVQKNAQQYLNSNQNSELHNQINNAQQNALALQQQILNQVQNSDVQKQIADAQQAAAQLTQQALQQANQANAQAQNTLNNLGANPNVPPMPSQASAPDSPSNTINPNSPNLALVPQASTQPAPTSQPQATIPAPAPTANYAQALISSTPQGAKIFVNDQNTGLTTPATLNQLLLNTQYKIRLEKQGYYNLEGLYTPTGTALQEVNFPMKALAQAAPSKPKVKKEAVDTGDFRLKQRPPPGVGSGQRNGMNIGGYGY